MSWLTTGNADTVDSTVKTLKVSRIGDNGRQYDLLNFIGELIYNAELPLQKNDICFSTEQDMNFHQDL
ncbi:MAG: hypothetical protein IPI04_18415 [Ignavibacteria bacterium]|nr:hypothetical protein [Ignavibacteria bacterium]